MATNCAIVSSAPCDFQQRWTWLKNIVAYDSDNDEDMYHIIQYLRSQIQPQFILRAPRTLYRPIPNI